MLLGSDDDGGYVGFGMPRSAPALSCPTTTVPQPPDKSARDDPSERTVTYLVYVTVVLIGYSILHLHARCGLGSSFQ